MRPQTKVAILTGAGILFLAALLSLFSKYVLLDSYKKLENRHVLKDLQRVTLQLGNEIESLQRQLKEWTISDDVYAFAQKTEPRFITRNLANDSLNRLRLSAIAFTDKTGRIIYGAAFDHRKRIRTSLPLSLAEILSQQSPLLTRGKDIRGVILLPSGPAMIASEPVPAGTVIACRPLSDDLLNKIGLLTQLRIALQPFTTGTLPNDFQTAKEQLLKREGNVTISLSDTRIAGYSLVRDISGTPAFILRAVTNRDFYQEGIATIRDCILWFSLTIFIAGAIIIWLFNKVTLTRIESLENEKIWQLALEGCGDGVWDWNIQTGEMFFSEHYKEILGYSAHELENRLDEWLKRIHPDDYQVATEALEKIQRGENFTCSFEHRIRCKNGDYRWFLNRGKIIHQTADGKPVRITGTITDTTEHKLLEEQVFKSQRLESVGVLAGGIAHDFNNILTAIIGYTSLARIFLETPNKALKALEEAEKASHRATELTRQLLTFAKGGTPIKRKVSAAHLLHESISFALRGTKAKGNCTIPESMYVEADEEQMNQAFCNILLNAAQAMPDGGEVTISAENVLLKERNAHELPAGSYIMISFSDQGCGIPPENLGKIFDPFFSTRTGGTGLGLSTAYSVTRKHGGTIEAHSTVGAGTTISLYLPSVEKEFEKQRCEIAKSYCPTQSKGHILVMDDEEMIRNMSSELLGFLGYQVCTCSNGEEAVKRYKTAREADAPFSAAILDLTIASGMGGKDAANAILAIDPDAKLIVSSGYSNDPVIAEYEKYGFIAAVSKPYTIDKLLKTIDLIANKGENPQHGQGLKEPEFMGIQ